MIKVENIVKTYRGAVGASAEALRGVSFEVRRGELFGLVGPDGAGKTTLFRILNNLVDQDSGKAYVGGIDTAAEPRKLRGLIGYMPGRFALYQDLSVEENLNFFAAIFGADPKKNYDIIAPVYDSLLPFKKRLAGRLSGGMKQKLALCCALVVKPQVLMLDEPTTGVDPVFRQEFWDCLVRLKNGGMTILASTPYMAEASMCDRVAFMSGGKILRMDTAENVVKTYPKTILKVSARDMFKLLADLRAHPMIEYAYAFGDSNHAVLKGGFDGAGLADFLRARGNADISVSKAEPSVEDAFIDITR